MTNRLETALEQTANVFMEMAQEIRAMRAELSELEILVHRHETINNDISKVFQHFHSFNGGTT